MKLAVVIVMIFGATRAAAADVPAAVTLSGQRVRLAPDAHELTVDVTVHNDLDVALDAVDVGWMLARESKSLEAVRDPGPLYLDADDPKLAPLPNGVMVLRRVVSVVVPAHGSAVASLTAEAGEGAPAVYRTHVLSYALADASLPLVLRLLHGSAAADEKAAVDYFGLAGDAVGRLAARRRLSAVSAWVDALVPRATAPVPQHPTASEAHERIYAIRALGVVGGERAEAALAQLRDRSDIALLDDLVRVVLIDRLRGTRLETPLAFAVPPSTRSMRDLVDVALADARDLAGQADKVASAAATTVAMRDAPETSTTPQPSAIPSLNDGAAAPMPRSLVNGDAAAAPADTTAAGFSMKQVLPMAACLLAFIVTLRLLKGRRR